MQSKDGVIYMNKLIVLFMCAVIIICFIEGCTYQSWYDGIQESHRQECYEYQEPERTKCLEEIKSYDKYKRDREEIIKIK